MFHAVSCSEPAAKRAFTKDDIRQASIGTSVGEGCGKLEGDGRATGAGVAPWIAPSRGCVQPHSLGLASSTVGGQTRVFWALVNEDGRQSKTVAAEEPAAAAIIATLAPTLRAEQREKELETEKATANCFSIGLGHQFPRRLLSRQILLRGRCQAAMKVL